MTTNIIGIIGFLLVHVGLIIGWYSIIRGWIRYKIVGIAPALAPVTGFVCWIDWLVITDWMGASW